MGFFRPKGKLSKGDFRSDQHTRPLVLGTKPNRITSFIGKTLGKPFFYARNLVLRPFDLYLALQKKRRILGTQRLLEQAYAKHELFVKQYAPEVQKIIPALTDPQITPFGENEIVRALGGIEERLARVEKGNPRKMDNENVFATLGITRRLTIQELEILKRLEANRQYVLAESRSVIREIALAALSNNPQQRAKLLKDINERQPNLIANSQKAHQELWANQHLYAQLEQEYNAMHQRMYDKDANEAVVATKGETTDI